MTSWAGNMSLAQCGAGGGGNLELQPRGKKSTRTRSPWWGHHLGDSQLQLAGTLLLHCSPDQCTVRTVHRLCNQSACKLANWLEPEVYPLCPNEGLNLKQRRHATGKCSGRKASGCGSFWLHTSISTLLITTHERACNLCIHNGTHAIYCIILHGCHKWQYIAWVPQMAALQESPVAS